jgi:glycosyltransferase involved in cell wall biosynthesis
MRVTFLTHYYPPEVGAPQERVSALARELARAGFEITVHTCFPHYPDGAIKAPYGNRPLVVESDGPVRLVRSFVYPSANRGFARRLLDHASFGLSALATARRAGPADAVVVETPPLLTAGAAVAYARLTGARLVVNVSDLWPDSAIELGAVRSRAAIGTARAIERKVYREATAITCPTEGIAERLRKLPESARKVHLILPAVDLQRFQPDGDGARRADSFRLVYIGTIGLAQGLGTLVEAAAKLERDGGGVEVLIAGDGAEAGELRARLANHGPRNVRMLGAVEHERVPNLYAESDAAVVLLRDRPLFTGAIPTKMLEAMAAARPLVVSAAGEAARFVSESGAGVTVPPEDPIALAGAIRQLASDRERASRLGEAGRRRVEAGFDRSRAVGEWRELLRGVIAGG